MTKQAMPVIRRMRGARRSWQDIADVLNEGDYSASEYGDVGWWTEAIVCRIARKHGIA